MFFPPAFFQRKPGSRPEPGGQRGAAPQGGFGGTPPEGTQRRAAPGRWSGFGPAQVQTCNVGSRPVPGGGSRLSLEKARTQRVAGEGPRPPIFMARLLPLARFGGRATLFRSWGYYGAHLHALIWIRILREQGVGAKAFCCRGIPPTKASPWVNSE